MSAKAQALEGFDSGAQVQARRPKISACPALAMGYWARFGYVLWSAVLGARGALGACEQIIDTAQNHTNFILKLVTSIEGMRQNIVNM